MFGKAGLKKKRKGRHKKAVIIDTEDGFGYKSHLIKYIHQDIHII